MSLTYAIDFGTTNSLLAAGEDGEVHAPIPLDPMADDPTILRSVLYFPSMKQVFYGVQAIREFAAHDMEGRLIRSMKKHLPHKSIFGTYVEDRAVNLEDLVGFFLGEMRKRANAHFGEDVTSVVLGRPVRFSDNDEEDRFAEYRLERGARNAGFTNIEFCPEPVAAAREFRMQLTEPKNVLIADFGGGTSDFTVIRMSREAYRDEDVLAIGGVALAGDSLDGAVMRKRIAPHFGSEVQYKVPFGSNVLTMPKLLMEKICSPADISLLTKRDTMEFLRNVRTWSLGKGDKEKVDRLFSLIENQIGFDVFEEIERSKRRLSQADKTVFDFKYPDADILAEMSRADFNEFTENQVRAIVKALDDTIAKAQVRFEDIDVVCCTGGTAKVPVIQEALAKRFGREKLQQHNHFHSIVQGLAERAREIG